MRPPRYAEEYGVNLPEKVLQLERFNEASALCGGILLVLRHDGVILTYASMRPPRYAEEYRTPGLRKRFEIEVLQ